MTRFPKKTLALAVSALLSMNAHAVFNIYNGSAAGDALTYASEITVASTGTALTNTGSLLDLQVNLGYEIVKNQEFYVRIDLGNAKFAGTNTDMTLGVGSTTGVTPSAGGKGQNFVIYTVKAAELLKSTDAVAIALSAAASSAVTVSNKSPVTVTYGLYQTGSAASSKVPSGRLGSERSAEFINFSKSGVTFKTDMPAAANSVKIDVGDQSLSFITDNTGATTKTAQLGKVTLIYNNGVYLTNGSTLSENNKILSSIVSKSSLVVEGDFAAALDADNGMVFLSDEADCSNPLTAMTDASDSSIEIDAASGALTATSATFTLGDGSSNDTAFGGTGGGVDGTMYVCMTVDGATEINGGQYTAKYIVSTAQSGYSAFERSANLVKLVRNGAILQTPFFNLMPGYVPRFYLTNAGDKPAPFTVKLQTDAAATGTLAPGAVTSGEIPAKGAILLKADQIATGGQRGTAIFQVLGLDENINGLYQFRNQKTGNFDSHVMPHRAYIYGPPKE